MNEKGTLIWRTVVGAALVVLGILQGLEGVGLLPGVDVRACVEALLSALSFR